MEITIIIVSFNSGSEIKSCIKSIKQSTNVVAELVIVDNASTDQTVKIIKQYKDVTFIKSKINLGFAKACNLGAKKAKGKYILFLNPDTTVEKNTIENMLHILKKKNQDAMLGCKVLNQDKTIQPSCGNFPTITNVIFDRIPLLNKIISTQLIRKESYYMHEQMPDWISGVCMLMSKKYFNKVRGFDEKYFLYVEDIDICFRAKKFGFNIFFTPSATIYHKDMGKTKKRKPFKAKQIRKGLTIFFKKYRSESYCFIWQSLLRFETIMRPSMKISK